MADVTRSGAWARRMTALALVLSLGGLAAALVGALGSGADLWHFRIGFMILRWAFYAAVAGGVAAVAGLVLNRRARVGRLGARNMLALAVAVAFVLYLGVHIRTARSVPAIHDVATNLDDLPQFEALSVRADNLEDIPDEGQPELAAMTPEERWKALHREGYGDLGTVHVPWSVAETIERAEALAEEKGWEIARANRDEGVLEATATTLFFRFKDDVVLRARPAPQGGSHIDMRSISRVGGSDVGVNAERIRDFLGDLRAG